MSTKTPAMLSIERGEILTRQQCDFADGWLMAEGIKPLLAFVDDEVNLYHREIALSHSNYTTGPEHILEGKET
jgi:hypothetical protein